jgi:hypothetical protein
VKKLIVRLLPAADLLLAPFVYPAAWLLKALRTAGVERLPFCRRALLRVGVFPIRNHFYEPQFDHGGADFSRERSLPGIDWNVAGQLGMLARLTYAGELADVPQAPAGRLQFHFNNGQFESGDAEYWYQVVRAVKPRRIVEIGSGNSTLMAAAAIAKNRAQDPRYRCEHTCIEPYLMPWLEQAGVAVLRAKVEDVGRAPFASLAENDILFIDSSHIIRPQGDVLFEYLELLPSLAPGVIVHVHDIFSPRNYLARWLREEVKFWNEQYLLEAFLSHNRDGQILGALNWLHHHHYERLKAAAPYLTPEREPGSFYLRKLAA